MNSTRLQSFLINGIRLAFDWKRGKTINETWCRRSAMQTVALCHELAIEPEMLVDVGANDSEFAAWVLQALPSIRHYLPFEPNERANPIGHSKNRYALSNVNARGEYTDSKGDRRLCQLRRFDLLLCIPLRESNILKIDAEEHSFKALCGFGQRIHEFQLVVIEVTNQCAPHCDMKEYGTTALIEIVSHMTQMGFNRSRVLDTGYHHPHRIQHLDVAFWRANDV